MKDINAPEKVVTKNETPIEGVIDFICQTNSSLIIVARPIYGDRHENSVYVLNVDTLKTISKIPMIPHII